MIYDQAEFDIRCEWGEQGVLHLAPVSDVVIVVDVLSLAPALIAVARGAIVFPFRSKGEGAAAFARAQGAELAGKRGLGRFSLSPASLSQVSAGQRLVLPSPNGSTLSLASGDTTTLAGCLRNASAVARLRRRSGAGSRSSRLASWRTGWSLRPGVEDWLGAGAIIQRLPGALSPEARLAVDAFRSAADDIQALVSACSSPAKLIMQGFDEDVRLATTIDADESAPCLIDGAYRHR
ncbi:MAG: 2-phosphosulfolactate phosphatase [Caldilineales bacterium]